jgi:hypothetical protein
MGWGGDGTHLYLAKFGVGLFESEWLGLDPVAFVASLALENHPESDESAGSAEGGKLGSLGVPLLNNC